MPGGKTMKAMMAGAMLVCGLVPLAGAQSGSMVMRDPGGQALRPVRCESLDGRNQFCHVPGRPVLVRRLSEQPCIERNSWGVTSTGVWVGNGCRAEFIGEQPLPTFAVDPGQNHGRGETIECESIKQREQRCLVPIRFYARLVLQTSQTQCIETRTWGWDGDGIWVRGGCRGRFEVR